MSKVHDNSDVEAKILLRNWLLDELGGDVNVKVLELFGGMGHMYDACYKNTKQHLAFDKRKVNRPGWLQGDNRTLLATRAKGWNLYDADAYSDPWVICNDVCRLREPGVFGMAMTCCVFRTLNNGSMTPYTRQVVGYPFDNGIIARWYYEIIETVMLDWQRHGVKVLKAKRITSQASYRTNYFGVIVEKTALSNNGKATIIKPPAKKN